MEERLGSAVERAEARGQEGREDWPQGLRRGNGKRLGSTRMDWGQSEPGSS